MTEAVALSRRSHAVNFTFGGPGGRVLYITTDTAIWAAVLATAGAGQD